MKKTLHDGLSRDLLVSLPLVKGKPIQEPAKFAKRKGNRRVARPRPLEGSAFQAAVQQPEAIVLPIEHFEFVSLTVAENKQARSEGIELKPLLNQGGQPVDRFASIRAPAG
ncbi:hypothetical protein [Paenibacillus sp. 23TSA30-6]|uniref:hypothetical protein n=1 Tax=Paenibacillus sp. 23TSA30-6 TaxID=2546104 RepID=UPI001EE3217A|nr:hypothetical protein [Paenibacillus sp. 23TSA30-6]